MKKTILILSAVALLLILLSVGLLLGLFSGLHRDTPATRSMEDYLAESWPLFRLQSWDEASGALELEYPLQFNYAQMEKYGGTIEELRDLPAGNVATANDLKIAAWESAGLEVRSVTVRGLTTDGQIAYTVYPDGSVTACWDGCES